MHSDWYRLFAGFWWLLFPLFWGVAAMFKSWMRHKRAQQALEVIQAYAQQGKEMPPELLKVLQQPERAERSPRDRSRGLMIGGYVLLAMSAAFVALTIGNWLLEGDKDVAGLVFVVVMFGGIGAALLTASRVTANDSRPDSP
jgi:hypothetical protein